MSESWVEKPSILITENKLKEFIPKGDMSYPEKLNALTRLILYVSIIIFLITREPLVLLVPICCMMVIYFLVKWGIKMDKLKEHFYPEKDFNNNCETPTVHNPFMNILPTDNRNRDPACNDNKELRHEINNAFEHNLYKNIGDVFGKENSQRQFYTMPSTTIPNKREELAEWLYKTPPTCKEGGLCLYSSHS